jgi:prepilin-type N-terminal cleavage/methylation domain-containing protein
MDDEKRKTAAAGFTLVELMIVVSIIATLAVVATPKFASLLRKSNEGASKGNLGTIRSALNIYYADAEGHYPADLSALTVNGKYLTAVPSARVPDYHAALAAVGSPAADDGGGWTYNNIAGDANFGTVLVNCTHTDTKGSLWTSY